MKNINTTNAAATNLPAESPQWKPWQKFSFRFFLLYFAVISSLCWDVMIFFACNAFPKNNYSLETIFKPLAGFFYWLDKNIYHTGYNPKIHANFPQDNHYGEVFYLTMAILCLIAAVIWSVLDRKRRNYNRMFYWFSLYLRYLLAIVVFGYGMIKLIPVQMSHPDAVEMLIPFGYFNKFSVLWNFMGMSPGYMIFSGLLEVMAALLLFPRRTAVAGSLLAVAVLTNVVALNWFYNVSVKIFSAQLLLYGLFLLIPYIKTIFGFFFNHQAAPLPQTRYELQAPWQKRLLTGVMIAVPLSAMVLPVVANYKRYQNDLANSRKEKIYEVVNFVATDTLPPLTTDTLRWRRALLNVRGNYFVVWTMNDDKNWFEFETDSIKKTFTLHNNSNKATWKTLHYSYPSKDKLLVTGKWKGRDFSALMKLSPVDSIPLNKEQVQLIQNW